MSDILPIIVNLLAFLGKTEFRPRISLGSTFHLDFVTFSRVNEFVLHCPRLTHEDASMIYNSTRLEPNAAASHPCLYMTRVLRKRIITYISNTPS